MSLRARIEGKARRTATFPLQVGNVAAAAAAVAVCQAALDRHLNTATDPAESTEETLRFEERSAELRRELAQAQQAEADTVVLIELQSLDDDVFDAVLGDAPRDDDGDVDLTGVRAALLAASCIDEELQAESWWAEQLARPEYSKGDLLALNNALLALNLNTPDGRQGKG
ncbi:hypothetical protein [Blastococcus sp. TF02A-26]|uniref:hypothetical protein n=1 Tax=Blastococcus sp. TF02A-26 TaxID=2250577 RepID=UPI000DE8B3B7|nr:hypothetical protein [Blastococcus sp. TF02A-26]RBY82682.1 hypothetical protein DQ240_18485 [Blastococcus sp. TF02A-26]